MFVCLILDLNRSPFVNNKLVLTQNNDNNNHPKPSTTYNPYTIPILNLKRDVSKHSSSSTQHQSRISIPNQPPTISATNIKKKEQELELQDQVGKIPFILTI